MDTLLYIIEPVITTVIVLAAALATFAACKIIHKMFPQIAERIMSATPWMGWEEDDTEAVPPFVTRAFHPIDR